MKFNKHMATNEKKPENQIILIDFSYWYYKFNLLPIIGTMQCKVVPHHIKQGLY